MDSSKQLNTKVHNSKTMKRSIMFLLCVSLLCVLFSWLPLLLQALRPFLGQFFCGYLLEKSCMFLLCNGLLLLITLSGLININSSPTTHHQSTHPPVVVTIHIQSKEWHIEVPAPIAVDEIEPPQEEEEKILEIVEQENVLLDTQEEEDDDDEDKEEEEGNALAIKGEDDHTQEEEDDDDDDEKEEEEGNALAIIGEDDHSVYDTEELNKKCEDFIRRMKETFSSSNLELRFGDSFHFDQKSLVPVN